MAGLGKLILLVDDDRAVRDALQFVLRLEGFCVHAHRDGAALLADRDLNQAACVVVEDRMPKIDGFALLNEARARGLKKPVIILASHVTARVRVRAAAAGVWSVLEKPLLGDALLTSIRTILDGQPAAVLNNRV